jgi:hypothetical protein
MIYQVSTSSPVPGGTGALKEGIIYFTSDYSMFKKQAGNRPLETSGLKRLELSIEENGPLFKHCPIKINKNLEVLDGQHRLNKAEEHNLPIYFELVDGDLKTTQGINQTGAGPWKSQSFLHSQIELGNEEYKKYKEFQERFKLGDNVCQVLLSGKRGIGTNIPEFKQGKFKIVDYSSKVLKAEKFEKIRKILMSHSEVGVKRIVNKRDFQYAIFDALDHPSFDFERMIKKLQVFLSAKGPHPFTTCKNSTQSFKRLLAEVYTYKAGFKEKGGTIEGIFG